MERVLAHTGARDPIVQVPMGWMHVARWPLRYSARAAWASSKPRRAKPANCQREITQMAANGLPFGANLPIRFLKEDAMLRFVCDAFADLGIRFVTTSAGSPAKFIAQLKAAASSSITRCLRRKQRSSASVPASMGLWSKVRKAAASRTPKR